jgi:hypothetical protein
MIPSTHKRPFYDVAWTIFFSVHFYLAEPGASSLEDDDWVQDQQAVADSDDGIFVATPLHYANALDFRDLFLPPEQSTSLGGTGLQPYGNLVYQSIWPLIEETLFEEAQNIQESTTNQMLIGPFTEAQSGTKGSLVYVQDGVNFGFDYMTWLGKLDFKISNVRIDNIDTFLPIKLLQPTTEPHVLTNEFQMGVSNTTSKASGEHDDAL